MTWNHAFQATGITAQPKNRGKLDIANREPPRTVKLHGRRDDAVSLDEAKWIAS